MGTIAVAGLWLAGCSDANSDAAQSPPFEVSPQAALASTGTTAMLFQGRSIGDQTSTSGSNDVALFDQATREWAPVEPPPIDLLYGPTVASLGDGYVVVGIACATVRPGEVDSMPACEPGTAAGARYDADTDAWTELPPLAEPASPLFVGTAGAGLVFQFGERLAALETDAMAWTSLPPLPTGGTVCPSEDGLLLVDFDESSPIVGSEEGPRFAAASLPAGGNEWVALEPPPVRGVEPFAYTMACTGDGVLALPYEIEEPLPVLELGPDGTWSVLASPATAPGAVYLAIPADGAVVGFTDKGRVTFDLASKALQIVGGYAEVSAATALADGQVMVVRSAAGRADLEVTP